jgi:hypothetical protein
MADAGLSVDDRDRLCERIGTYLADLERAGQIDLDDVRPTPHSDPWRHDRGRIVS